MLAYPQKVVKVLYSMHTYSPTSPARPPAHPILFVLKLTLIYTSFGCEARVGGRLVISFNGCNRREFHIVQPKRARDQRIARNAHYLDRDQSRLRSPEISQQCSTCLIHHCEALPLRKRIAALVYCVVVFAHGADQARVTALAAAPA